MSWFLVPLWDLRPDIISCRNIAVWNLWSSVRRPLWREDGSPICSVITQWSESLITRNHTLLSRLRLPPPTWLKVEDTLRLIVSQSVCLGIEYPCGTCDQILLPVGMLLSEILQSCICEAPSLTRGRVCNLQCNHSMVQIAQNPQPYFTVSSETPPTWRARFPYLYPPGTGWPSYTPGHWVPFMSSLTIPFMLKQLYTRNTKHRHSNHNSSLLIQLPFMVFAPSFTGLTCLSYIHFTTFTWTSTDAWHF
jgi:hypothetical protein